MKQSIVNMVINDNETEEKGKLKMLSTNVGINPSDISTSEHQDLIAAEKKSIGFDYQFLYFLYVLMNLKPNEKAGYEVKDDVHIELKECKEILIQLKHSLQTNRTQKTINMTEKDKDLWKSLYNWSSMINEIKDEKLKRQFIDNTTFVLVTNKENSNNKFFKELKSIKTKAKTITEFKVYLDLLKSSIKSKKENAKNSGETDSEKLKKYISFFSSLDSDTLLRFIDSIEFQLSFDDLLDKIRESIISNHVSKDRVDYILETIIGNMSIWKFETVKNKGKIFISFEDFDKRVLRAYQISRGTGLVRNQNTKYTLPIAIKTQNFIQELIEIDDIDETDMDLMIQYTTYKLRISNYINEWVQEGLITELEHDKFKQLSIEIWRDTHRFYHQKSMRTVKQKAFSAEEIDNLYIDAAINCLHEIRQKDLILRDELLQKDESNGYFYLLSDENEIGWKIDWQSKYRG